MAIRSDSSTAKRIVSSFIDFLRSVEIVPGKDAEGLEVAAQCLSEIFGVSGRDSTDKLLDFFENPPKTQPSQEAQSSHLESSEKFPESRTTAFSENSSTRETRPASSSETSHETTLPEAGAGTSAPRSQESDVFEQFMDGLDGAGYFNGAGGERAERWSTAQTTFSNTLKELAKKGRDKDRSDLLAEAFKGQGNQAMSSHRYGEAINLYTLAISICAHNAIYFANRAAAHTQVGNLKSAISDCNKAIEIDPSYSKAYSRLGLCFYSKGYYADAVQNFKKALELDPRNSLAADNLQSAIAKLNETPQRESTIDPEAANPAAEAAGANVSINCEAEIPSEMLQNGAAPFAGFVQSVMQGLASGSNEFPEAVGPEFANYANLFGGMRQRAAGTDSQGNGAADGQQQNGGDEVPRVQVESPDLSAEITERLQAALQTALGGLQPGSQPHP